MRPNPTLGLNFGLFDINRHSEYWNFNYLLNLFKLISDAVQPIVQPWSFLTNILDVVSGESKKNRNTKFKNYALKSSPNEFSVWWTKYLRNYKPLAPKNGVRDLKYANYKNH